MRVRNRLLADTALTAVRPYADLTIEGEGDEGAGGGTLMDQGAADSGADQGQAADNSEADASQGEGGENAAAPMARNPHARAIPRASANRPAGRPSGSRTRAA